MPKKHNVSAKLAEALEEEKVVREIMRHRGHLLGWCNEGAEGVPSLQAIAHNARVMQIFASVYCAAVKSPKSPPIAWIREEANVQNRSLT